MKICHKCLEPKPITSFRFNSNGYQLNECDDCKAEYQKIYQAKYTAANKKVISDKAKEKRAIARTNRVHRIKPNHKTNKELQGLCLNRGCHEHSVEFKGLTSYCKSHAFDQLNK